MIPTSFRVLKFLITSCFFCVFWILTLSTLVHTNAIVWSFSISSIEDVSWQMPDNNWSNIFKTPFILARGENLWLLKYARLISLPLDDQQSLPIITGLIMLLKTGSDANVKDENGNTTAHILAQNYRTPEQKFTYVFCLDQLHQAGAIFNQANNDGVRVFYLKIGIDHPGYTDWIHWLVGYCCSPSVKLRKQNTIFTFLNLITKSVLFLNLIILKKLSNPMKFFLNFWCNKIKQY